MKRAPLAERSRLSDPVMWWTVGIGYGLAATIFVVRLAASELPVLMELPGAVALAMVVTVPPTLALFAWWFREATLLVSAGLIALSATPVLSVFAPVMAVLGLIWF